MNYIDLITGDVQASSWMRNKLVFMYIHLQSGIIHYGDVTMNAMASQITSLTIVYSTVYSDADQSKHQSSASLAFVWGIHRGPVNSPHKWPVTRKMFPFDDVIMQYTFLRISVYGRKNKIIMHYSSPAMQLLYSWRRRQEAWAYGAQYLLKWSRI